MMAINDLFTDDTISYLQPAADSDVVIASRVRLARNLREYPFPNRANINQLAAVLNSIDKVFPGIEQATGEKYYRLAMEKLSSLQREVLIDKMLISSNFGNKADNRAVYIRNDAASSIMINEDDHLRIQCMAAGLNLKEPLKQASLIDDAIEAQLDIAFDEKMGYLTACPTNLGTGIRASVLLHLPGLVFTNNLSNIVNISPQLGLAVRPVFGGEKETVGAMFQISNQLTLGYSEKEIIDNLTSAVTEIVAHERRARKALALYMKDKLEDEVWRAFGLLAYARILSEAEAIELLSKIRLGVDLKIINEVTADCFAKILLGCRTSFLQNLAENENMSESEINRLRAKHIHEILKAHKVNPEENP